MNRNPYPTPTFLDLLAAVENDDVHRYSERDYCDPYGQAPRRVDAHMADMERLGWVVLRDRRWDLTDKGRKVLARERSKPSPPADPGRAGAT